MDEEKKDKQDILIDIIDSDYPLMKKFREAAPSSYKHGQTVANTTEIVGAELGLDVKLMKSAGFLHDIGKMLFPEYFSENQSKDKNPHDGLDPIISYLIITRHVADSVNILLNDLNVPRQLIEIISQHHGSTTVRYFYQKECKKKKGKNGFDYKYKTTRPKSIEAMVLMICDIVDAQSKSIYQSGKVVDPEELVERVISECLTSRQFDDVSLRLGMLADMKQAIIKDLAGSFQKRVDYEEDKDGDTGEGNE